jgi:zona occludens toxin (predicted ATPase)
MPVHFTLDEPQRAAYIPGPRPAAPFTKAKTPRAEAPMDWGNCVSSHCFADASVEMPKKGLDPIG